MLIWKQPLRESQAAQALYSLQILKDMYEDRRQNVRELEKHTLDTTAACIDKYLKRSMVLGGQFGRDGNHEISVGKTVFLGRVCALLSDCE